MSMRNNKRKYYQSIKNFLNFYYYGKKKKTQTEKELLPYKMEKSPNCKGF
jgi:hypothetical protein